jgi:ABC-type sulfate transport system permease component
MFTPYAIILANIFVTFPLAFGVIKPVFDTMSRSLEEASATIGATRWQTFWHVTLPSLRGAIVSGALLTFARAVESSAPRFWFPAISLCAHRPRRCTFSQVQRRTD